MAIAMFAIKTHLADKRAVRSAFAGQKTMYGGRRIAAGDAIFVFASENSGGAGLAARGVVRAVAQVPRKQGVERQTPRVSVVVERTAFARRPLGRRELRGFCDWDDGRPETELNFKLYRQATDKIVGISADTARFLDGFF